MEDKFKADVIQYLMPNGREKHTFTYLPIQYQNLYNEMVECGNRFEAEMLSDYNTISITIFNMKMMLILN